MIARNERQKALAALKKALSDKTESAVRDRTTLRDAVCAYFFAERARGTSVKKLTQTLKDVLRKTESGGPGATDALAQQLVDWCAKLHGTAALGGT